MSAVAKDVYGRGARLSAALERGKVSAEITPEIEHWLTGAACYLRHALESLETVCATARSGSGIHDYALAAIADIRHALNRTRWRGGRAHPGMSPYRFTTAARDRRSQQGYVPDAMVRAKLRAGIEEFRRMLEGKRQEVRL